jgi:uncharacterized protein
MRSANSITEKLQQLVNSGVGGGNGEGAFYVWTAEETEHFLGRETAFLFSYHYGVEPLGNVPPDLDLEGGLKGKNILYESHSLPETAKKFGKTEPQTDQILNGAKHKSCLPNGLFGRGHRQTQRSSLHGMD